MSRPIAPTSHSANVLILIASLDDNHEHKRNV